VSWWGFAALLVIAILIAMDRYRSERHRVAGLGDDEYLDEHDMRH
jgi:hypothetical protein